MSTSTSNLFKLMYQNNQQMISKIKSLKNSVDNLRKLFTSNPLQQQQQQQELEDQQNLNITDEQQDNLSQKTQEQQFSHKESEEEQGDDQDQDLDDDYQQQYTDQEDYSQSFSDNSSDQVLFLEDLGGLIQEKDISDELRNTACGICLEEMSKGRLIRLGCQHTMHEDCLKPWVEKTAKCPTCKANLFQFLDQQ